MHALNVPLGSRSYPVLIGRGILGQADLFPPYLNGRQVLILTDENVAPLWGRAEEMEKGTCQIDV